MASPEVTTQDYNQDELISGLRGVESGFRDSKNGYDNEVRAYIDRYIGQLDPTQLVGRYQDINQGGGLEKYYRDNYNVGSADNIAESRNYQAYSTMRGLLGRDPNANELAQALPAFQGPNGLVNGRAFIANLAQQYKMNPNLDPGNPMNNQNPMDVRSSVANQFKSVLGRDATPEELQHFGQAIQSNQIDAYGLTNFLKQQPEYQGAQDKQFRTGLNDELTNADVKFFDRAKQGVMSQFMQNGTSNSSALDSALTDLMGQLAEKRGNFLSTLSAQQYGGNKDLAVGNYKNTLDQMYGDMNQRRAGQSQYGRDLIDRGFQGADYEIQRRDYMNFLQNQPQSRGGRGGAAFGPLLGAGIGALGAGMMTGGMGAGAGAQLGASIGGGVGSGYDYLNY